MNFAYLGFFHLRFSSCYGTIIPFFSLPPFSFHLSFAFKRYANVDTLTLQGPFSHVSSTFASVVRINFGTCFSTLNVTIRKEHELYYLHLEIKLPILEFWVM